jgi:hypothetical protein
MNSELSHWLYYECFLSLLPITLLWVVLYLIFGSISIVSTLRDGQLFYYSTSLASITLGDMAKLNEQKPPIHLPNAEIWTNSFITIIISTAVFYGVAMLAASSKLTHRFQGADRRIAYFSSSFAIATTVLIGHFRNTNHLW